MFPHNTISQSVLLLIILFLSLVFSSSYAEKLLNSEQIKQQLSKLSGQPANDFNIYPSELKNFVNFKIDNDFGLISRDAKYLIQGDLINIETGANLTNELRYAYNLNTIAQISSELFIPYQALQEKSKIWVFSDVNCFYCQKLHREMEKLNNLGITVNYISFPRSGQPNNDDWKKATLVWCAKDRKMAMNIAKRRQSVSTIPQRSNCKPQISLQYNTGKAIGVRGTPTIVLTSGKTIPGYIPAKELADLAIHQPDLK